MVKEQGHGNGRGWSGWRIAGWSLPVLLLLLPLISMMFVREVYWTASDFAFAAIVFGAVGLTFEFVAARSRNIFYRLGAGFALLAAFAIVWCNPAVGMIGSEDNPYNLLFLAAIAVAAIGAAAARLKPGGMALAMLAAGLVHVAVGAGGFASDPRGGVFSMLLSSLWFLAAALFRGAAHNLRTDAASI